MSFSNYASMIKKMARAVVLFQDKELLTEGELIDALFQNACDCEAESTIEELVSLVPEHLYPAALEQLSERLLSEHPGVFFVLRSSPLTTEEQAMLDSRMVDTAPALSRILNNPVKNQSEMAGKLANDKWFMFRHLDTIAGSKCKKQDCNNDRVKTGVFCREHHYKMVFGENPPDVS